MSFTKDQIEKILREEIAAEVKQPEDKIDATADFASHGLDSLSCIYFMYQLEKKLDRELNPSIFWDFPTINSLTAYLHKTQP